MRVEGQMSDSHWGKQIFHLSLENPALVHPLVFSALKWEKKKKWIKLVKNSDVFTAEAQTSLLKGCSDGVNVQERAASEQ